MNSFLDKELIAGRQTILFTPLNSVGENFYEDAPGESLTVPRSVHSRISWKIIQTPCFLEQKINVYNFGKRSPTQLW